ncbi:MAG TPA: flagellar hook-associated protein FlgK [Sphingomonas sp.]|uniref:flagellar hook-associated protein FlgK n=1 Tax=Sphingomonas sp. TaxID=28214 RepID=UPI002BBF8977|nr:flagellar hook-associated protein FlgK [Sphingomonas sp.]HMI19553.1 flagellar hook-associated protein FlgK [Sphingomonas sp.]
MSDLLSIGKSGVLAYQSALAGISENVVNANNDGFARREVTMKEQAGNSGPMFLYRTSSAFNGVQAATVTRVWDQYTASKAWSANSDNSQASMRSQWYGKVEDSLDDGDSGVGVKLTAMFTSANALSANPTDATLRQSFLYAIQDVAGSINKTAASLVSVAGTVSSQASDSVRQVNDALTALAKINVALKTAPQGTSGRAALEDQRDTIIGTISDKVGIDVTLDTYGAATVRMNSAGGPVLLDSSSIEPAQLSLQTSASGTLSMSITSSGTTSAVSPTSGGLAGYAEAANQIAGRRQQLDALATSLATQVNTWNAQGTDLNGNPGADLLSGTDAASLSLAVTDPSLVAAADATNANGNLLAISSLRGANGVETAWRSMVTDQGLKVQSATTQATSAAAAKDSAYSDLDDVSGVDLDTEAADLMRFQQAYSASAKIIQTARETLQSILDLF